MTAYLIRDTARRMGRPPLGMKATQVRLPADLRERIERLVGNNQMAKFIREAVEGEVSRREKATAPKPGRPQKSR